MSALIVIRLVPATPVDGGTFAHYLDGLKIEAFDLSYGSPIQGQSVGVASYIAPSLPAPISSPPSYDAPPVFDSHTGIVQQFDSFFGPPVIYTPVAVATAVIPVTSPTPFENLRIVMTRGGDTLRVPEEYYNVQLDSGSPTPDMFPGLAVTSLYLTVPAVPLGGAGVGVTLPTDGTPPVFDDLVHAITTILGIDPGGAMPALASLTPGQCGNIAREILWSERDPLPAPPDLLESLYNDPPNSGSLTDSHEQARQQFEGALQKYYAPKDADAQRLTTFIYAVAAAYQCQAMSLGSPQPITRAIFELPVNAGHSSGGPLGETEVMLVAPGGGALPVSFGIPAAYFYALGATIPPQVDAPQRYRLATGDKAPRILAQLAEAATAGYIDDHEKINGAGPDINPAQAARRLTALGITSGNAAPPCPVTASVANVIDDWLAYGADWPDATAHTLDQFWVSEAAARPGDYLDLVLNALTEGYVDPASMQPLAQMIRTGLRVTLPSSPPTVAVTSVEILAQALATDWKTFFYATPGWPDNQVLPPFTGGGNADARLAAFIRHIQQFFAALPPAPPSSYTASGLAAPPTLAAPSIDWLAQGIAAYEGLVGGTAVLGSGLDADTLASAAASVFPGDADAQAWLVQALTTLDALAGWVGGLPATPALRFSIMEALYARGFTRAADIQALSLADFEIALIGTVAYDYSAAIYAAAGGGSSATPTPGSFEPVNPGDLVNCLPPPCRSPFGAIEYLHELLALAETATCDDVHATPAKGRGTLGDALATRRGPLATLLANSPNLDTPLPLIDLVNENLENLAATGGSTGVVYDTDGTSLAGHTLCATASCDACGEGDEACHDPATLYATLPAYSSPAVPLALPDAYAALASDFSAPGLPYAQAIDVNRSYLCHLKTSRFDTLRHFRRDITDFVHDPSLAPPTFQAHLWRYPVSLGLALAYLCFTDDEANGLFGEDEKRPTWSFYGFSAATANKTPWSQTLLNVSELLARTGLSYCELVALQQTDVVPFRVAGSSDRRADEDGKLPACEPCYLDRLTLTFGSANATQAAFAVLIRFVRLWRKLQCCGCTKLSMADLADIFTVLQPITGGLNLEFLRQLAALLMLHDDFAMPLRDRTDAASGASGADRLPILALWVGSGAAKWDWALTQLILGIRTTALHKHGCAERAPQFLKLLADNLDSLSRLGGFDPAGKTWHEQPTSTLRLAEVLAKLYASPFHIGEVLYLFSADAHLDGDDPFPLQTDNEALDFPLALPEDQPGPSLWALREALLSVRVDEQDAEQWTWPRIAAALRDEFGYPPSASGDALQSLGQHFFPHIAGASAAQRQYRVPLSGTTALIWNTPLDGPFQYDDGSSELWTQIPLRDAAVIDKLASLRPLAAAERQAVQDLYFLPRLTLAPFAFLFEDFAQAERELIENPHEDARWRYFQYRFALTHARCRCIAGHLAHHVGHLTRSEDDSHGPRAWTVLKHLYADENRAATPWEDDSGATPSVHWQPPPNGGAFAALLGLVGVGLMGEYHSPDGIARWRTVGVPGFDAIRDRDNSPVPTLLPAMDTTLSPELLQFMALRNGYALDDRSGALMGGAEGFSVRWQGVLLVEESGEYHFLAGSPTPEGEEPNFERAEQRRWRVTLQRGQRTWEVLDHQWSDQQEGFAPRLHLQRGAYGITIDFAQPGPRPEDCGCETERLRTGFQLKYRGPDSGHSWMAPPLHRLFLAQKDATLAHGVRLPEKSAAGGFLQKLYRSSLRDIRRTYQRAFKATLFSARFGLSAERITDDGQSELGYMLANPDRFAGRAYYDAGSGYVAHAAGFDFNLLPLLDNFLPPDATADDRVQPSLQREQALFDWWERTFDYVRMRTATRAARSRPAWLLFHDAKEQQPDDPAYLLRHLGIDLRHADAVTHMFDRAADDIYTIGYDDLEDDRWAIRAWHSDIWMRRLAQEFAARSIADAKPYLWASADPSVTLAGQSESGNANLVAFVQNGEFENGLPRRYDALRRLNDGLRERARNALVAYLTRNGRVPLPWGGYAHDACDLGELLLIDTRTSLCEKASRIEEAISAVQSFIRRARLGLEPGWQVSAGFARLWDKQFASYHVWERCKQRLVYRENWIEWAEWAKAERIEAFQLLTDRLRRNTLSIAVPGVLEWWPDQRPPQHAGLIDLQAGEPAQLHMLSDREGLGVQGLPERDGRLSWLAPLASDVPQPPTNPTDPNGGSTAPGKPTNKPKKKAATSLADSVAAVAQAQVAGPPLPYWLEAAVKLGRRFYRVAAAGEAMAGHTFAPAHGDSRDSCCQCCGQQHPPLTDEYYFWLEPGEVFDAPEQTAGTDVEPHNFQYGFQDDYYDAAQQQAALWQSPDQLPQLLAWQPKPTMRLAWTRVHNGEFQPPRRSDGSVEVNDIASADLQFLGRTDDSLAFAVTGAATPPLGYHDSSAPGFRYDLPSDVAVTLPLVDTAPPTGLAYPGGLPAYPFFLYGNAGAALFPAGLYAPVLAVACTLRANCRFEPALKWLQQAFDALQGDNAWIRCGRDVVIIQPGGGTDRPPGNTVPIGAKSDGPIKGTIEGPGTPTNPQGCCNSAGVNDATARNRSVTLHTIDVLLAWADAQMRKQSPEAFQQARLLLDTADRILGARPTTVASAAVDDGMTVGDFVPGLAPLNPRLLALYDHVADRRGLLHRCEDTQRLRNGRPDRDMPYFGDCIGGGEGCCLTVSPCTDEPSGCHLPSPYRFDYLIAKAQQVAGQVRELGAALLTAFEKGDAEYLADMRARFETEVFNLNLALRQDQWRDADWQIEALQKTKAISQTNLVYYTNLVNRGLIPDELQYQDLTTTSMVTRAAGNTIEAIGEAMKLVPDLFVGFPCEETQLPVGTKLAGMFESIARIINTVADIEGATASLDLTNAGWERRSDEWIHQTQVLPIEIQQIERQILGAQRRREQAMHELNMQQRQNEQSKEALDFLRDKFSADALYLYLQKETAALYYESHALAMHIAHQAQRAFHLERGDDRRRFVPSDTWDSAKEGLLAGERLEQALARMDQAYRDENVREYELTKHFSLRLHFPQAYLRLRATGKCEIELPEWMFDADYPGMYMRRIKNVSLTLPCVTGPFTGVHCRLTLLSSRTRIDPSTRPPAHHCCDERHDDCCYEPCCDDPRFMRQYAAREAIATSDGNNDDGLFELNFRDERYLPFEYHGAVSRWRIELPHENNYFDVDTLTDVVLHLNYTAREGGEALRCEAARCAQRHMPGEGWSLFEISHEFPSAWARFQQGEHDCEGHRDIDIELHRKHFPFVPHGPDIEVSEVAVLFDTRECEPLAEHCVDWAWLKPTCHGDDIDYRAIRCFASGEWPCLYHGLQTVQTRHIATHERQPVRLRLKEKHLPVKRMFLLCRYRARAEATHCHTAPVACCGEEKCLPCECK